MEIIQFNDKELEQIHGILFDMMCEVHRICMKHDIKYVICGGTLLGAVRHKGFIPWDDDVDIRMERNEYNKFCEVCQKELDEDKYFFQTYKTDKYYPWFYGKLRYNYSQYTRIGQEHLKMNDGVFIDIFVSDGVPNGAFSRRVVMICCYMLKKALYSVVGCKSEKSAVKRFFYRIINLFPKSLVYKVLEYFADKYSKYTYECLADYSFSKVFQEGFMPRYCLLKLEKVEFNEKEFMAPCAYEDWLRGSYGDYMQLPPLNERKGTCNIVEFRVSDENIQKNKNNFDKE